MRQMTRRIPLAAMIAAVGLVNSPRAQSVTSSAPTHKIPLRPGLTIVTALYEPDSGDYESIKTITEANDARRVDGVEKVTGLVLVENRSLADLH